VTAESESISGAGTISRSARGDPWQDASASPASYFNVTVQTADAPVLGETALQAMPLTVTGREPRCYQRWSSWR
jgi:hypothetical protein